MTLAITGAVHHLAENGLGSEEYVVVGGASLVLRGMRSYTEDIDMLVSQTGFEQLTAMGAEVKVLPYQAMWRGDNNISLGMAVGTEKVPLSATTHLPGNGTYPMSFESVKPASELVQHIPCLSIDDMIASKLALGREKDIRDLQHIGRALGRIIVLPEQPDLPHAS